MSHNVQKVNVSHDDTRWETEVKGEIPADALEKYREETLKEMQKTAKLDGFRQGHVPLERIISIYGEPAILKHAAEHAIQHELPELLVSEQVLAVETPRVTIQSIESGKPLAFSARIARAPKVELPDYKTIAKKANEKKETVTVSDEEHKEALLHLKRERARIDRMQTGMDPQKALEEARAIEEKELPELDDAFVQSIGYENMEKFSTALRENIQTGKENEQKDKRRQSILDELIKKATIHYPASLKEYELDDMEARIKDDLRRIGRTFDEYLTELKKTREALRDEWKDAADKRARIRLALSEIARAEKIEPDAKILAEELEHAKKHYPQADVEILKANIAHAMRNEATIQYLESL